MFAFHASCAYCLTGDLCMSHITWRSHFQDCMPIVTNICRGEVAGEAACEADVRHWWHSD